LTPLAFVVPGPLDQLTGGYLFDRRLVDALRADGRHVDVIELDGRFPDADARACAAAARTLERLPDGAAVVVDGLALPAFDACIARHATRLRIVGFVHHPLSIERGLDAPLAARFAALEARLWPRLSGVICPSEHTARAVRATGVAHGRVAVAGPGTSRPPTASRASMSPAGLGPPRTGGDPEAADPGASPDARPADGTVRLLAVGTLTPRKGHALLVDALSGLRSLPWRLDCVGSVERDPQCTGALRRAIRAAALDARVALHGELPPAALERAYRAADVFVLPSYHEGYGMAFAEALAHGLPIVATTAGAIPEVVPADASRLVPPGDAAALRAALGELIGDASLRDRLAARAARAAGALPDWPAATRRWADALDRLVAGAAAPTGVRARGVRVA